MLLPPLIYCLSISVRTQGYATQITRSFYPQAEAAIVNSMSLEVTGLIAELHKHHLYPNKPLVCLFSSTSFPGTFPVSI